MNICRAAILMLLLSLAGAGTSLRAQEQPQLEIKGGVIKSYVTNGVTFINEWVQITYLGGVLTADQAVINQKTGDIQAQGRVRLLRDNMVWTGENVTYNFYTRKMETAQFRTGKSPFFASGEAITGESSGQTNAVYTARKAYITSDDIASLRRGSKVRTS